MSVDFFWRRTTDEQLHNLSVQELRDLVLHWFDDGFHPLVDSGRLIAVERHGYLMHVALLAAGADDPRSALPVFGGVPRTATETDSDVGEPEFPDVIALPAAGVQDAADFLDSLDISSIVTSHGPKLAEEAHAAASARPGRPSGRHN